MHITCRPCWDFICIITHSVRTFIPCAVQRRRRGFESAATGRHFQSWDAAVPLSHPRPDPGDVLSMRPWVGPGQYIRLIRPPVSQRELSFCKCQRSSTTFGWLINWRHKLKLSYFTKVFNMPDWSGWAVIYAWEPRDGDTGRNTVRAKSPLSSISLFLPLLSISISSCPPTQCLPHSLILSLTENTLTPDLSKLHIIDWNKRNRWCHEKTDLLFNSLWITDIWKKRGFLRDRGWR